MNASLTFNSIVFEKSLTPQGREGSFRQSSARGYNLQDVLSITAQPYTDAATKVAGTRRTARLDGYYVDASGVRHDIAFSLILAIPEIASTTDVTTVTTTFKAIVANADFIPDMLNSEE